MSIELSIFKAFCEDRELHTLHRLHVAKLDNLDRSLKILFNLIDLYYDGYEAAESVSVDKITDFYDVKFPASRDREVTMDLVHSALERDIETTMVEEYLDQLHEKYVAGDILNSITTVIEGSKYGKLPEVRGLIDDYMELMHHLPPELEVPTPCEKTLSELIEEHILTTGLNWTLPRVTDCVGGLKPKTLGLVYAYTDAGKSSFMWDNVVTWSQQLEEGENICYCSNEEDKDRHRLRHYQSILKKPWDWLGQNIAEAEDLAYNSPGYDKVNIFDEIVTGDNLIYVLKTYRPKIIVIDQATDIEVKLGNKNQNEVVYAKKLFKWYRSKANIYETSIVGVAQGGLAAENSKWLKLSDIYGSNSGIQGNLDYACGIGRIIDDPTLTNKRYLNFPKNKLNGGGGSQIAVTFFQDLNLWRE